MATFYAKPAAPELQQGHRLADAIRLAVPFESRGWPPRDRVAGRSPTIAGGVATVITGTPLGPAPTIGTIWSATYPGSGLKALIDCTLWAVCQVNTTNNYYKPIRTDSSTAAGVGLLHNNTGSTLNFLFEGVAIIGSPVVPWITSHMMAVAGSIRAADKRITLYSYDYDTGIMATATATTGSTAVAGNGNALVGDVSNNPGGSLSLAGWSARIWSIDDFRAFVADPFGMLRPELWVSPAALLGVGAAAPVANAVPLLMN